MLALLLVFQDFNASFSMTTAQPACYLGNLAEREREKKNVISLQILFLIIRDLEF
jgi:hypothetical protein